MSEPEQPDEDAPASDAPAPRTPETEPAAARTPETEAQAPRTPDTGAPARLDPLRAVAAVPPRPRQMEPVIDTRKYQWTVGIVGVVLVAVFSVYLFLEHGVSAPGVGPGSRIHYFVAPLAGSGVNLPANADPKCNPAKPNPKGLNVCGRRPLVLAFFVTGETKCTRQVDALQRISGEFPLVQFAAVAVSGNLKDALALQRRHHWTIQIGVDSDGRVGEVYGVEICPMVEIVRRGGTVVKRLIGDDWANPARLASQVRLLERPPA